MRNYSRIRPTMDVIEMAWLKNPDLRLTQLIQNALGYGDHYHLEDDKLLERIKDCYLTTPTNHPNPKTEQ